MHAQENPYVQKVSLNAGNNLLQNGLKMAKDQYYIRPAYTFYHDSGYYFGAYATIFPENAKRKLDNIALNVGYDKDFGDHFSMGIDYTYSYYMSSLQVTASAAHMIILSTTWYSKYIMPSLLGIWNLGSTNDFTLNPDLSHFFIIRDVFREDDKITIPVALGAYMGSSNYLNQYTKKNNVKETGTTAVAQTAPTFRFTSLYLNAGIKYRIGDWAFSFTGIYSKPIERKIRWKAPTIPILRLSVMYYF